MALWHKLGPFTVFDLETTGLRPAHDRIIEIGAVRVEVDGTLSRFSSLINPGVPIPPMVTGITGIRADMVKDAPKFSDVAYSFLEFIRGSKLVAHHARFDLGFMQESLARSGLELLKGGAYDSVVIIRSAYPNLPSYRLSSLCASLSLPTDEFEGQPHRAAFDAEMTMCAFSMAMKRLYEIYPEPDAHL